MNVTLVNTEKVGVGNTTPQVATRENFVPVDNSGSLPRLRGCCIHIIHDNVLCLRLCVYIKYM